MIAHVLVASVAFAAPSVEPRHEAASGFTTATFVAPEAESSVEGPFGVLFVPRYRDAASAEVERVDELRQLERVLDGLAGPDRSTLRGAVERRLEAVRHWRSVFEARTRDPLPADARVELLRQRDLLAIEEGTLDVQLSMLGGHPGVTLPASLAARGEPIEVTPTAPPERHSVADDRVVLGGDVVIGPDERVRDAVAVGGDVIVRGVIEGDAVALGGDVEVADGGRVLGEATAIGGDVELEDAAVVHAKTSIGTWPAIGARGAARSGPLGILLAWAVPLLAFAGVGVLTSGLVPDRVDRVAGDLVARPWTALATGALGAVAAIVGALLFTITLVGIPVALALLGVLAAAWLLGVVAVCTVLGERLPVALGEGRRWVAFLVGAAVLALLAGVPVVGGLVSTAVGLVGVGAALATRFGRA